MQGLRVRGVLARALRRVLLSGPYGALSRRACTGSPPKEREPWLHLRSMSCGPAFWVRQAQLGALGSKFRLRTRPKPRTAPRSPADDRGIAAENTLRRAGVLVQKPGKAERRPDRRRSLAAAPGSSDACGWEPWLRFEQDHDLANQ